MALLYPHYIENVQKKQIIGLVIRVLAFFLERPVTMSWKNQSVSFRWKDLPIQKPIRWISELSSFQTLTFDELVAGLEHELHWIALLHWVGHIISFQVTLFHIFSIYFSDGLKLPVNDVHLPFGKRLQKQELWFKSPCQWVDEKGELLYNRKPTRFSHEGHGIFRYFFPPKPMNWCYPCVHPPTFDWALAASSATSPDRGQLDLKKLLLRRSPHGESMGHLKGQGVSII